jgi:diguanylate cyclase (GGDEF)-like protein
MISVSSGQSLASDPCPGLDPGQFRALAACKPRRGLPGQYRTLDSGMAARRAPPAPGFVVEWMQTAVHAMTPDPRPVTLPPNSEARSVQRRRAVALAAAAAGAVGLGAMLGHGLAQSLATVLPPAWLAATPALAGAAVAALLVPLAGWAAIRIVAPALPRPAARPKGLASVTPLRAAVRPATAAVEAADAQAPARDALTGAYTQQHFVAAADREWSRIRRHGEDAALLMIDIDHFKRLNEEHGSSCGDAMLVEITRLASTTLRPYDLLARFGGGVLVVYLPHTDPLGALDVAERIRERVAGLALLWQGKRVRATVSVGVAGVGAGHAALDAVIADAGAALREAKNAGRNCVRAAPIPPRQDHTPARSQS